MKDGVKNATNGTRENGDGVFLRGDEGIEDFAGEF